MDPLAAHVFPLHEQVLNDTCTDANLADLLDTFKQMLMENVLSKNFIEYINLIDAIKRSPPALPHKKTLYLISLGHSAMMQEFEISLTKRCIPSYNNDVYTEFFYPRLRALATRYTRMEFSSIEFLSHAAHVCAAARIEQNSPTQPVQRSQDLRVDTRKDRRPEAAQNLKRKRHTETEPVARKNRKNRATSTREASFGGDGKNSLSPLLQLTTTYSIENEFIRQRMQREARAERSQMHIQDGMTGLVSLADIENAEQKISRGKEYLQLIAGIVRTHILMEDDLKSVMTYKREADLYNNPWARHAKLPSNKTDSNIIAEALLYDSSDSCDDFV